MMKRLLLLIVVLVAIGLSACQSNEETMIPEDELIELTLEELSFYDGKEGRPAYIAVNGEIYDVSDSVLWQNGGHNGFEAGQDLTDAIINESPHGLANLSRVPKIGILVDGD
ncbi:MAG TPA: cytochrome b5 domain-containing protein [Acholeplasmataceae bacterium]|nr:cytochrome b5 domain-containing protein [Acholeplasmataceae bacterium]